MSDLQDFVSAKSEELGVPGVAAGVVVDGQELTAFGSHLGRKAEVRDDGNGGQLLLLAGGRCSMTGDETSLHFAVEAPDQAVLERVQAVVGGHLERFAAAEGIVVVWQRKEAS